MTPEVQSTGAAELRLEVSRELCRRYALPWFQDLGWHLDQVSADQATAILDLRAFCLGAEDEVFSQKDLKSQHDKLNDWIFNLSAAFRGEAHSDCLPAIVDSVNRHQVPRGFLFDCLSGIESSVYGERMVKVDGMRRYCFRRTGSFLLSVAQILGAGGGDDRDYFAKFGVGLGMLDVLVQEQVWGKRQWCPVPDSWLKDLGIRPAELLSAVGLRDFSNLTRRIAIQGIEELGQLSAPPTSLGAAAEVFQGWLDQSIGQLHDIYSHPGRD